LLVSAAVRHVEAINRTPKRERACGARLS